MFSTQRRKGVARGSRLVDIRIAADGLFDGQALVAALQTLTSYGGIHIANISLEAYDWTEMEKQGVQTLLNGLLHSGILPMCASGNTSGKCSSPGDLDAAFTIGATTKANQVWTDSGSYNQQNHINSFVPDVVAPSTGVWSADSSNNSAYRMMNGTSQATAVGSGMAALRWEARKSQSPTVKDIMADLVFHTLELGVANKPQEGKGLIQG